VAGVQHRHSALGGPARVTQLLEVVAIHVGFAKDKADALVQAIGRFSTGTRREVNSFTAAHLGPFESKVAEQFADTSTACSAIHDDVFNDGADSGGNDEGGQRERPHDLAINASYIQFGHRVGDHRVEFASAGRRARGRQLRDQYGHGGDQFVRGRRSDLNGHRGIVGGHIGQRYKPSRTFAGVVNNASAQRLASALEPLIGQVYFSPECHANYVALGFGASSGDANGVALPDGPAYFTSRGSMMGQVPGEVVAAGFGVFSPAVVIPFVDFGWSITDVDTIFAARQRGATAQLVRVLGESPDGLDGVNDALGPVATTLPKPARAMSAGLASWPLPDSAMGRFFRYGDLLREYRGDVHNAIWVADGLSACEIGLVSELWWGLPLKSYSRTRGWTSEEFDVAVDRLKVDGWLDGDGLSADGTARRAAIEDRTDALMVQVLAPLGDALNNVVTTLVPWGAHMRAAHGYLPSGPHDLANR
jgi:hypothetical protein